jgi:hypothetical protein
VDDDTRIQRALAEMGEQPLPPAVAARLDVRLAAELDSSPLAARRAGKRLRLGASLSAAAAVAAVVVFALSTGGGSPRPTEQAGALRDTVASATAADSAAVTPESATTGQFKIQAPTQKCAPASRKADDRPRAGCPGARGGRARAV